MKASFTFAAQIIFEGEVGKDTHTIDAILSALAANKLRISYISPSETIGDRFVIILTEK